MVSIDDDSSDDSKEDIKPFIRPSMLQKPRAARNVVSNEKSLSINTLPDWAKPYWRSQYIPSLLHIAGDEENPWEIDRKQEHIFIQILQDIVGTVYTGTRYSVEKNCKIFRLVSLFYSLHIVAQYYFVVKAGYCRLASQLLQGRSVSSEGRSTFSYAQARRQAQNRSLRKIGIADQRSCILVIAR